MRKNFHVIVCSLIGISLFSCNRDEIISDEENSVEIVAKDHLSILIDKVQSISSETTFLREEVIESFPKGEFEEGELMGMNIFKINEQYSLVLELVSPDPNSFRIAPATPTAFEERPTGVILEVEDDSASSAEYDPPEIPESITAENVSKRKPGYRRLVLLDADGKTLYDSMPERHSEENKTQKTNL